MSRLRALARRLWAALGDRGPVPRGFCPDLTCEYALLVVELPDPDWCVCTCGSAFELTEATR